MEICLRNYAHLGDAVWELYVRETLVFLCQNPQSLHRMTTEHVMASFQAKIMDKIDSELTEEEQNIKRRARNMEVPVARRNNQNDYRIATAFEALLGYWYVNDKERLKYFCEKLLPEIKS